MGHIRRDDLERAQQSTPEERLAQALEMMRAGFRLKIAALRERHPEATEAELEAMFTRWLAQGD